MMCKSIDRVSIEFKKLKMSDWFVVFLCTMKIEIEFLIGKWSWLPDTEPGEADRTLLAPLLSESTESERWTDSSLIKSTTFGVVGVWGGEGVATSSLTTDLAEPFRWMRSLIFLAIWAESSTTGDANGDGVDVTPGVSFGNCDGRVGGGAGSSASLSVSPGPSTCKSSSTCSCKATSQG